jgi:3-keto-5-aminohexanoate cleavage enzyme
VSEPVIVTCALVGGEQESPNPHHPRTLDDVVREGIEAARAGAAVLHVHARTRKGEPTQDPGVYREIADAIRAEAPDVLFNFTTGGSEGMTEDERLRSLEAGPEIASLDVGSMNFGEGVFLNPPAFVRRAAEEMRRRGILPELECFEAGMVAAAEGLAPGFFQLVLGVPGGAPARVDTLCHLASLLPQDAVWAATAIGREHFRIMAATLALGGHVRTGLEDVAFTERGVHARSNAELVERTVAMAEAVGRPVASPVETREILGL